jgi:hypothetical protein
VKPGVFAGAGGRQGAAVDNSGNYVKPSKNEATVFNHLDSSDY